MPHNSRISTTDLRYKNRNIIYRYLYQTRHPRTKQEIAQELSFSLPTVTQNLNELLEAGLIAYAGFIDSSGGRRARTVQIVADAKIAVGIELSTKQIQLVAIDLYGQKLACRCVNCKFEYNEEYQRNIARLLEHFLDDFSLDRNHLLGVGITLPGVVNRHTDTIEIAPVLHVKDMDVSFLTERIPYPVLVGNDASDAGYAECWNWGDQNTMAYLLLGKGVGGAVVIEGKPYFGQNHRSAEFGHICIEPNGRVCSCGMRGCFEAYCSTVRISDDLGITLDEFFSQLNAGNQKYKAVFDEYIDHLVCGIHTIRMMMDCEVVLGGRIVLKLEPYVNLLREKLAQRDIFESDGSYLHLGTCGAEASCIGAGLRYVADFLHNV